MDRIVNLSRYLPDEFADYQEYQKVFSAEEPELSGLWEITENLLKNSFLTQADSAGLSRFEDMLHIVPLEGDTIESRRMRLQTKWMTARPFTITKLHEILTNLCGVDGYEMTLDQSEFALTVKVNLAVRNQEEIVYQALKDIVPANILLTVTLLYNTWSMFASETWGQVKTHTWEFIKEGILT